MKRVIIIVMDSVGIGELPDAAKYGDVGSNTLGNITKMVPNFRLPNLERLGLSKIEGVEGLNVHKRPMGCYGRMNEKSAGKDTTTGHWEIAGIITEKPFPVYPNGFPEGLINEFKKEIESEILGNEVASGTEIINRLGHQHVMTGYPIVYTSADSVFQIAAHEEVIPLEELYKICKIARNLLTGDHAVGRVIARPFTGTDGKHVRTDRRRDFSLKPTKKTLLDFSVEKGLDVKAVGKIEDIFAGQGITDSVHTHNNINGLEKTISYIKEDFNGLIFTNLVDFDMIYGHRNNVEGYAEALIELDSQLPELFEYLKKDDLLILTADHGCDPTTKSTDHSREYVPLLVYGEKLKKDVNLGTRDTFADIAATAAEYLGLDKIDTGTSFYKDVIR